MSYNQASIHLWESIEPFSLSNYNLLVLLLLSFVMTANNNTNHIHFDSQMIKTGNQFINQLILFIECHFWGDLGDLWLHNALIAGTAADQMNCVISMWLIRERYLVMLFYIWKSGILLDPQGKHGGSVDFVYLWHLVSLYLTMLQRCQYTIVEFSLVQ